MIVVDFKVHEKNNFYSTKNSRNLSENFNARKLERNFTDNQLKFFEITVNEFFQIICLKCQEKKIISSTCFS